MAGEGEDMGSWQVGLQGQGECSWGAWCSLLWALLGTGAPQTPPLPPLTTVPPFPSLTTVPPLPPLTTEPSVCQSTG